MSLLKSIVAAGLLLALPLVSSAAVQMPREGLVADRGRAAQRNGAEVLHPLRVDRAAFERARGAGGAWLPAKDGTPMYARFAREYRHPNGDWTWVGRVETRLGGQSAVITFGRDATFGKLPQRSGPALRIQTRQGRTWLVENQPRSKLPAPGTSDGRPQPLSRDAMHAAAAPGTGVVKPAAVAQIDVLVAYTPSLVTEHGGESATLTRINQLVAIANTAYVDSNADMHLNLVSAQPWNHTAENDNSAVLDLISNASADPLKTQIDSWRNTYGADLVAVVRGFDNSSQSNCGLAWIGGYHGGPYQAQYGFSVSGDGEDEGYFCYDETFAHELGHNMGATHDITTSGGDYGAYTYSRGHRQSTPGNGFATVMAYPTDNQELLGIFSNPLLSACLGQPCGIAGESDNVQTFANSGPPIAAFRATVPPMPTLTIADVTVAEGNAGTSVATFTVSLSAASTGAVTYTIATSNGTATAGSDYTASTLTGQTIAAGATSKTFAVTIAGDTTLEAAETFNVTVSAVVGAHVGDGAAVGTITNDDGPTLSIGDVAIAEGNSGTKTASFVVTLSAPASDVVGFDLASANGTATAGSDYVALALAGQTIAAGATSKAFNVTLNGDTSVEANETFTVQVSALTGPVTLLKGTGTGTILNDDGAVLSIADVSLSEGNAGAKYATFSVRLSQAAASPVTFSVATVAGSATAGSDFVARSLTGQTIPAGQLAKPFTVQVNGDATVEGNETFIALVSAVTGPVTVLDDRAIATILNDDGPVLSFLADAWVIEGHSGTKTASFTVRLAAAAAVPVSFTIGTANGSASSGSDYVAKTLANATIPAGQTTYGFTVTVNGDADVEPNDTFFVNLSSIVNATASDAQAVGTIINDEGALLTIADRSMAEGNAGEGFMAFTLTLNQALPEPMTFGLQTVNASALGGSDYNPVNVANLTFPANTTTRIVNVKVYGDTVVEGNEQFYVLLKDVVGGASVYDDRAIGTITNDD